MKSLEEKKQIVDDLVEDINSSTHFYLADISGLNAEQTTMLRRKCFESELKLMVVKNTLLKRALDQTELVINELDGILEGPTSIIFTEKGAEPAKVIKEFRKKNDKPLLKGAYVEESVYIGDDKLEDLANIKSKEELIGDLILQLQSPLNEVMSSLRSGNDILSGVMKTLSEKKAE